VPGGAHPSYTHGYYKRDNKSYLEWDKIAADREAFGAWIEANVMAVGPEVFAERVKGLR
jgi:glutaconate CoA-transferase subunit A